MEFWFDFWSFSDYLSHSSRCLVRFDQYSILDFDSVLGSNALFGSYLPVRFHLWTGMSWGLMGDTIFGSIGFDVGVRFFINIRFPIFRFTLSVLGIQFSILVFNSVPLVPFCFAVGRNALYQAGFYGGYHYPCWGARSAAHALRHHRALEEHDFRQRLPSR